MIQPHSRTAISHGGTLTLMAAAVLLLILPPSTAVSDDTKSPVATVNGIALYQSELDCAIGTFFGPGPVPEPLPPQKQVSSEHIRDKALQTLIDIELLYQEGLKYRFPGIEEKVEKRYRAELDRMGGKEGLSEALSCIDMTPEDLKKIIFRNLIINGYLEKTVYSKVNVTDEELKEYYEQNSNQFKEPQSVRARQILIRVKTWSDTREVESAVSKATMIREEAVRGSDFVMLARKYSEDPSAGSTGGDIGIIHKGNFHKPMESILFSLPDGGVSEPVKFRNGIFIFKVVAVKSPTVKSFDDVRGKCMSKVRRSKSQAMIQDLVRDLRSKANIEILEQ